MGKRTLVLHPMARVFNARHDERVIGILTTGPKPIFLQCDNKLQKHRESCSSALTAPQIHARATEREPIIAANSGPIIRKPF
jgi:hypothetical protein